MCFNPNGPPKNINLLGKVTSLRNIGNHGRGVDNRNLNTVVYYD